MAKEWQTDKSSNPDAETRFIEIRKAYEQLAEKNSQKARQIKNGENKMPREKNCLWQKFPQEKIAIGRGLLHTLLGNFLGMGLRRHVADGPL